MQPLTTFRHHSGFALIRYYFVNGLLLLAFTLGLSVRHLVNGALLFLVLMAWLYIAVVFMRRHVLFRQIAADFAVPGLVPYILMAFFVYALYSLILYGFAEHGIKNRYENFFLFIIPLYFLLINTSLPLRYFCYALSCSSLAIGIDALYQVFYLDYPRAVGAHYAIGFGDIALLLMLFNLVFVWHYPKFSQKLLAVIASFSACAACFLSGTRGAWLAMPPLLLFIAWIYWREMALRNQQQNAFASSSHKQFKWVLLLVVLVLGVLAFSQKERISARWHQMAEEIQLYQQHDIQGKSVILRLEMWRVAWHMFMEHPFLGAGYGRFSQEMHRLHHEKVLEVPQSTQEILFTFNNAHSQYLEELGSKGMIGLVLLLSVLFLPLIWFIRYLAAAHADVRIIAYLGVITVSGFIIFAVTEAVFYRSFLISYYLLFIVLFMALLYLSSKQPLSEHQQERTYAS